jgi:hypothetical protein
VTSSPPFQPPVPERSRLDLHNASIDESAAASGHCGMTDLHTGRVCQEPRAHDGGCAFVAPSSVRSVAAPGTR